MTKFEAKWVIETHDRCRESLKRGECIKKKCCECNLFLEAERVLKAEEVMEHDQNK